ncbi:Saccharopine dehydrogenase-domain-containing protein [Phellopilus nigrolimitatus]|nr:Saccharopine dehydrogenase-domain-containing protein [Phellopilus nigrolimitatus]
MLAYNRFSLKIASRTRHVAKTHARHAHARSGRVVIGVRREDPQRIWERRCPLTPEAVERLVHDGFDVLVQPCERRIFKTEEFVKAGAKTHGTLAPAHILLGIKETPLDELLTDHVPSSNVARTHMMFSHTHKGQEYNMPLLSRFLGDSSSDAGHRLPTLIDWELLTDVDGKRTVGFGWYAGVAGALEGLISTAHLHLTLGVASPFLGTPRPHTAPLPALLASLKLIGATISSEGTPKSMGPFIVVVTGSGHVSAGALSILRDTLPTQEITVEDLPDLVKSPGMKLSYLRGIYVLHATQDTYLFHRTSGERAVRKTYYADPASYESRFHELIAPYTTLLINGVGWTPSSPRLMTVEQTVSALMRVRSLQEELQAQDLDTSLKLRDVMKGRCLSFADVSCDIGGGLAFLPRSSTLSEPFFSLDLPTAFSGIALPHLGLPSLQIMAVDILPTALPLEASRSFSDKILPYVRSAAGGYDNCFGNSGLRTANIKNATEIQEALERATITSAGFLQKRHQWLQSSVDSFRVSSLHASQSSAYKGTTLASPPKKKILLLGSGMVAGPTVEEICRRTDLELIIGSDDSSRNAFLCRGRTNAHPVFVNISDQEEVSDLVKKADVVISLLPVPLHPVIAELCIENKRHLVTASYISPAMRALNGRAVKSDVLLLNEIGLDPGVDHCSALALLSSIRRDDKKIVSFTSFCGGLPAPECADVPLKYKFSWSPRGVLSAALNDARFLIDGKTVVVAGENLLHASIPNLPVSSVLHFEGLPNRDSLSYSSIYDLCESDGLKSLFRGTIRYPGFSDLLLSFKQLGLLDTHRALRISSYSDLIRASIEDLTDMAITQPASMFSAMSDLIPECDPSELYETLAWLSNIDDAAFPRPPTTATPVIDLFATLLSFKLAYKSQERDLVVLHHEIISTSRNSQVASRDEVHYSSMEVYGTHEHSAMALCVGLPVAMAALRVLDGGYKEVGVHGPNDPAMYDFILNGMKERGLNMCHGTRKYVKGRTVEERLRDNWV